MRICTTKCGRFGHPEFVLESDASDDPGRQLEQLGETIEEMVASGSVFRPGQTFQIGWMITQVAAHDSGYLTLVEPDMITMPIRWVPGITQTLRQKMIQAYMLDSVGLREELNLTNICQSLIVCNRYTSPYFQMVRSQPTNERDSGWFVGCFGEDHDHNDPGNLACLSLYEAYLNQRGIHWFVLFPNGTTAIWDLEAATPRHPLSSKLDQMQNQQSGVVILKDDVLLPIAPGSFLEAWLKQRKSD